MAEDGSVVIDVKLNSEQADKQLAKLTGKIARLSEELDKKSARKGLLSEQLKTDYARLDELREKIRSLKSGLSAASGGDIRGKLADAIEEEKRLSAETSKMQSEYDKITEQIAEGTENLGKMKDQAGQLVRQTEAARPFENLSSAIDNAKQKIGTFIKYAIGIRTAYVLFRKLRSAISDSVKSFANYDAETRNSIKGLRASLDALKLSWGAAFAPILNSVAPLLQKLIGWLASAANAVAQFIAVLSGKTTYKRAIANSNKLADSVGAVGSAAKEAKNQLASFDELNILQDNSSDSGGGAGGGAGLGADMTEEQLSPWAEKLKNHLTLIKDIALGIGAALATWTIANFINQVLGLQLPMSKLLGLALGVGGTVTYFAGFIDAFNNGVNWDNIAAMIGGCTTATIGLGLAFGTSGAAAALLAGGIGMLLIGLTDWIKTGTLSTKTFWLLEAGIAAVGVAVALLVNPWALLVAAVAAAALAIYKHWDTVKEKWSQLLSWLQRKWDTLKEWWSGVIGRAGDAGKTFIENLMNGMNTITEKMHSWWNEKIKPWFTPEKWRELGRTAVESIKAGLQSIQMPRFNLSWGYAQYKYNFFGKSGTVKIPWPQLDWYAKGGVFDSASVIGVGEAGKEAVVPLERNTEWITLVSNGIAERLTQGRFADKLADAFMSAKMPAMAGGTVVPPNSAYAGSQAGWNDSIMEELKSLKTAISALASQPIECSSKLYIERREIGQAVTEYQRSESRVKG